MLFKQVYKKFLYPMFPMSKCRNDIDEKYEVNNNTDNDSGQKEYRVSRNIPGGYLKSKKIHEKRYGQYEVGNCGNSKKEC